MMKMEVKKRPRRRSIVREFCLNTSTHGLPGIARSETIHNRIFWSVTTAAFFGVAMYFVAQAIQAYFQYPSQTTVEMKFEWPVKFPAFSFCNGCPVRFDRIIQPLLEYAQERNLTVSNTTESFTSEDAKHGREFMNMLINQNQNLSEYFFPLSDMLIDCSFNSVPCNTSDFTQFVSANYGLCHTFNAKLKNVSGGGIRDSNKDGEVGVLKMGLYLHSHQCVPYSADAFGIRAIVHDNAEMPQIDIASMGLGPGKKHVFTFTKRTSYFLPPPYTQCTNEIPTALQLMYDRFGNLDYRYSSFLCYLTCIQSYTYKTCGCINPTWWFARTIVVTGTNEIATPALCNMSDPCYRQAADTFMKSPKVWQGDCICPQECQTVTLSILATAMNAPPRWKFNSIKSFVENSSIPLPDNWQSHWLSHIESNYVGIELSRERNYLENFTQESTLSGLDVLSNVGGHSGLWIGISFLSLMELAEMLYKLIRANIQRIRDRNRIAN